MIHTKEPYEEDYVTVGRYTIIKCYEKGRYVGNILKRSDGETWSDETRAMHHLIKEIETVYMDGYTDGTHEAYDAGVEDGKAEEKSRK